MAGYREPCEIWDGRSLKYYDNLMNLENKEYSPRDLQKELSFDHYTVYLIINEKQNNSSIQKSPIIRTWKISQYKKKTTHPKKKGDLL